MTLIQNLKFIMLLAKMKMSRMMAFRFGFFGGSIVNIVSFAIRIVTFSVIFGHVEAIGDWNRGRMIIYLGTVSLIDSLWMIFLCFGVVYIPDRIRSGQLDLYITKPGNPLLRLTFENIDPGCVPMCLFSIGLIAWGASLENISATFPLIASYCGLVALMTLLWYDLFLIVRTIPFFTMSASALERLEGDVIELTFKIPGTVYTGFFKVLFWTVLPYGIMATVPAQLLVGALTLRRFLYSLAVAAAFTVFALWFWKFGLRNYKSASS